MPPSSLTGQAKSEFHSRFSLTHLTVQSLYSRHSKTSNECTRMSVHLSTPQTTTKTRKERKLAHDVVLQGSTKSNTNSPVEPQIWSETQHDSKRKSFVSLLTTSWISILRQIKIYSLCSPPKSTFGRRVVFM